MSGMISGHCRIDGLEIAYAGISDPGLVRSCNEDNLLLLPEHGVFAVADGLGGLDSGDLASGMTLALVREWVEKHSADTTTARWASRLGLAGKRPGVAEMLEDINGRLFDERIARNKHMASTLVLVQLRHKDMVVGHVGDSRLYCRRNGTLIRMTADHSLVGELQEQGVMTAEQARRSPQKHVITRAIGAEPTVIPTVTSWPLESGDVLCLCSDGLTSMLDDRAIDACLQARPETCAAVGQRLVDQANAAGGRDNITVIVVTVG